MQIVKSYSGTLENIGSSESRLGPYGTTYKASTYTVKNNFFNQTIADFLHNTCGVDAAYEMREGSTDKFLWIYNVPFLFLPSSGSNVIYFFTPFNTTNTPWSASFSSPYSATSSGTYSFSLLFTGDAQRGFTLRFKMYGSSTILSSYYLNFAKATNILDGGNATVWGHAQSVSNTVLSYANGININEDGTMIQDSFSNEKLTYYPALHAKAVNKTSTPGKFPLVPLLIGIWKLTGIYQYIQGFGLPTATSATTEVQCEVEIANRRFINTVSESVASGYINFGLIEVTE